MDVDAVAMAAAEHLDVEGAAIVLVGDVDAFGPALEAEGLGRIVIEPDDVVGAPGASAGVAVGAAATTDPAAIGATDDDPETGPTAGAEDPVAARDR